MALTVQAAKEVREEPQVAQAAARTIGRAVGAVYNASHPFSGALAFTGRQPSHTTASAWKKNRRYTIRSPHRNAQRWISAALLVWVENEKESRQNKWCTAKKDSPVLKSTEGICTAGIIFQYLKHKKRMFLPVGKEHPLYLL